MSRDRGPLTASLGAQLLLPEVSSIFLLPILVLVCRYKPSSPHCRHWLPPFCAIPPSLYQLLHCSSWSSSALAIELIMQSTQCKTRPWDISDKVRALLGMFT